MIDFGSWLKRLFFFTSYLRKPRWDTGISPPELVEFLNTHPSGRAVDLGCGTGTNVLTMAQHGWEVTGVDFIPAAVKTAREKLKKNRITARIINDNVTCMDNLTGTYNLALDIGCYHSLNNQGKRDYETNLVRRLAPGGTFLLYGFLSAPGNEAGISDADLNRLGASLFLQRRQDGQHRERPSAWFEFQKQA